MSHIAITYAKRSALQNSFTGHFPSIIAKSVAKALHGLNEVTEEV